MEQIFKKGDKVYHHVFGWCIADIVDVKDNIFQFTPCDGLFKHTRHSFNYIYATKTFSFTEYELKGFSQEPPIDYNDYIGCWGRFWDSDNDCKAEGILKIIRTGKFPYSNKNGDGYKHFEPYPQEVLTALGLTNTPTQIKNNHIGRVRKHSEPI